MPNGRSDCCGTCWFNRKNRHDAGEERGRRGPDHCEIRNVAIEKPYWTYCANHPHRCPERDPIPIGPIMVDRGEGRQMLVPSPDGEEIRAHLLRLLAAIEERPRLEYPMGVSKDEVVVWQLGEWRERRAVAGLERIAAFDPEAAVGEPGGPLYRTRAPLIRRALGALKKIRDAEDQTPPA